MFILPGAAAVEVTEVVGQSLQLVSVEVRVVPEDLVVTGPGGALDALVRHQVEITLGGMVDALVDDSSSQDVTVPVLVLILGEEPGVMALLHHDEGDGWLVLGVQLGTGFPDCHQLGAEDCEELKRK